MLLFLSDEFMVLKNILELGKQGSGAYIITNILIKPLTSLILPLARQEFDLDVNRIQSRLHFDQENELEVKKN